jgi:magnesium and cobalt transporter
MKEYRSSRAAGSGDRQQSLLKKLVSRFVSKPLLYKPEDREHLGDLLHNAEKHNLLDADALAMIEGVLNVSDMQVREVMVPRSQMIVIKEDESPEVFLPVMVESAHSRFPVIGDSRDEVEGVILAKDVLAYFCERDMGDEKKPGLKFNLRNLLRPAVVVPESKRLNVLLKDFRANRNHMAIVVDEYGGVAGLVTIEDVLEQIVGDIEDEHDFDDDLFIVRHSDDKFTLKALTPIDEFNEYFESKLSDDEFDTIGGLLMNKFGRLPKRGESADIDQFQFTVLRADSRRIHLLQLSINPDQSNEKTIGKA